MITSPSFVIVGAGLAGATAAETLREEGFKGRIVLAGDEPNRPYERPPLSKEYLQGSWPREKVFVHPESWYSDHDVDLRVDALVTDIDRHRRRVSFADADGIDYDKLLLATGSAPRRLDLPGAELDGVQYLRRIEDSDRIKAGFARASCVAIVGAGWIGLETAAAARAAGLDVVLLERGELPLVRVLGREVAQVFADLHRDNKVDLRCGVQVTKITGSDGTVNGVRLADGDVIAADLVLVGVGITPNTQLGAGAGLQIYNGIVVDEHLRTADPDVYAAGDVANAYHPLLRRRIRVEHWANGRRQGAIAARSMLGQNATYDRLPYFFSDQFDLGMEYVGYVDPGDYDQVIFRGDVPGREFIAFWLKDGRVRAGMNVNVWDVSEALERLILPDRRVSPERLADPGVSLDDL